jgi:protein-disulfide isomerase
MRTAAIVFLAASLLLAQSIPSGRTIGPSMANVTVEVFSDYQCPTCKVLYEKTLRPLIAEYARTGKIRFVHREFPLSMHAYAREAACYACAADRVGKYEQVCEVLFRDQDSWAKTGKVADAACSVLTPAEAKRVRALAQDPAIKSEIDSDLRLGATRRVGGTPTMFITGGGRTYTQTSMVDYPILRRVVEQLMAR